VNEPAALLTAFGLHSFPFPKAPAPQALYRWPGLEEVLARLRLALSVRGFALLTGDVGAGKSTALRLFRQELDPGRHPVVYLADRGLSPREFYGRVLEHFGVRPGVTHSRARRQFQTLLADLASTAGTCPVVLLDEAQDLDLDMVQELRYLQNVEDCDAASPFLLILCGQPEIRSMLRLKGYEAIAQRLTVRCHLPALTPAQSSQFVTTALRAAGADRPLFTEAALSLLHTHAHGLCRPLALLATHALLDAAVIQSPLVEEASVRRAIAETED
jgi:general secretion pathway protein A